jgi:hypothetical protein
MSPEDQRALDLLEAAYWGAEWQERGGLWLLLTFLDAAVAEHAGFNPTERDTPEGRDYRRAVGLLLSSGAVEIPHTRPGHLAKNDILLRDHPTGRRNAAPGGSDHLVGRVVRSATPP